MLINKGVGKLIASVRNRNLKQIKIKKILLNRVDRIGDAILTIPGLLELEKQGYEITIMTSMYNDFILNKLFPTIPLNHLILPQESSPTYLGKELVLRIKSILEMINSRLSKDKEPIFDVFLNVMGISNSESMRYAYKNRLAKYYIGFNNGLFNIFQDYSMKKTFTELTELDPNQYGDRLLDEGLGIKSKTPDYIDIEIFKIYPQREFNFRFRFPFGVVFVGGGPKRSLTVEQWKMLIEKLAEDIAVVVIDDPTNTMLPMIKKVVKSNEVYFIKNKYSLFELLALTKKAKFFIGMDGGGTHILSLPANTLVILPQAMKNLRPHSNNSYNIIRSRDGFNIEETKTSKGMIKAIAYKNLACRPCFVMSECKKMECIEGVDVGLIAEYIKQTYNLKSYNMEYRG